MLMTSFMIVIKSLEWIYLILKNFEKARDCRQEQNNMTQHGSPKSLQARTIQDASRYALVSLLPIDSILQCT